jgi:hypothetical protein
MHELGPPLSERFIRRPWRRTDSSGPQTERNTRTPTVYTLIVDRSFVSVSGGALARAGSSARATWRNCSPKLEISAPVETLSGPSVPCVGPTSGTWYVSVCTWAKARAEPNKYKVEQTDVGRKYLSEKGNEVTRTPSRVLMHLLPIIVIRSACAGVYHCYQNPPGITYTSAGTISEVFFLSSGKAPRDVPLTLPPPPRHCPHGTVGERPPSAALGRALCTRTVRDPGARCEKTRPGCV